MDQIETCARAYARERKTLGERVQRLEDEKTALARKYLPGIKLAAGRAQAAHDTLGAAIADNPELFVKPRTITIDGVKLGLAKGKGNIVIHDEPATIRLIRRHMPEQADALIRVKESVIKPALKNLTSSEARKVGVEIIDTGDEIVIRCPEDEVDKLVAKLLESDPCEEVEA